MSTMTSSLLLLCGLLGVVRAIALQGKDADEFAEESQRPWKKASSKDAKRSPVKLARHAAAPAAGTISGCESFLVDFASLDTTISTSNHIGDLWSPCSSLKSEWGAKFSPELARFLSFQLAPKTAMEFGCGTGTMVDYLARQAGAVVLCIEPERTLDTLLASLKRDRVEPTGRLSQLALNIFQNDHETAGCTHGIMERGHDLVFSLNVAQHIPHHFHKVMIDLIAKSARKWLVFAAAGPTMEEERNHLLYDDSRILESSLSKEVWQQIFEMRGLVYMPKLSEMARMAAGHLRKDLGSTLMVFKHKSNTADDTDEPVEMLRDFVTSGEWSEETSKAVAHRADGASAMMWPSLTVMQRKVGRGELCSDGPDGAMLIGEQEVAKRNASSAWEAWGTKNRQ